MFFRTEDLKNNAESPGSWTDKINHKLSYY